MQTRDLEINGALNRLRISAEKFTSFDVLCLPENFDDAGSVEELYDASEAAVLSKHFKAAALRCGSSFDLCPSVGVYERRAGDAWLGFVWVLENFALPTVVGVLCAYLAVKFEKRSEPSATVHLKFRFQRRGATSTIEYTGDPESLIEILKSISPGCLSREISEDGTPRA